MPREGVERAIGVIQAMPPSSMAGVRSSRPYLLVPIYIKCGEARSRVAARRGCERFAAKASKAAKAESSMLSSLSTSSNNWRDKTPRDVQVSRRNEEVARMKRYSTVAPHAKKMFTFGRPRLEHIHVYTSWRNSR
ncbi:unnamed protein product [Hapterophycus canaliculatus]